MVCLTMTVPGGLKTGRLRERSMAIRRKWAVRKLQEKVPQVELHLRKIAMDPENTANPHWRHEVQGWLREMEALLPHVGKKTSDEWQARTADYRAAVEG